MQSSHMRPTNTRDSRLCAANCQEKELLNVRIAKPNATHTHKLYRFLLRPSYVPFLCRYRISILAPARVCQAAVCMLNFNEKENERTNRKTKIWINNKYLCVDAAMWMWAFPVNYYVRIHDSGGQRTKWHEISSHLPGEGDGKCDQQWTDEKIGSQCSIMLSVMYSQRSTSICRWNCIRNN